MDTVDTLTFNTEAYRTYSDNLYAYGMFQELRDRWHEQRVSETTQHFLLGGLIVSPQRMGGILVAQAGTSPDDPKLGKEYLFFYGWKSLNRDSYRRDLFRVPPCP